MFINAYALTPHTYVDTRTNTLPRFGKVRGYWVQRHTRLNLQRRE